MTKQREYILAIGESEGSGLRSYVLSKSRIILYATLGCLGVFALAFLLAQGILRIETQFQSHEIRQENERLKERFSDWETKIVAMQSVIEDLDKRNKQIRVTASLSTPEMEYGVGGAESSLRTGLLEWPEMNKMERNFSKLEMELEWIKNSTSELENTLSSKITEIAHYPSIRPIQGGWVSSQFGKRIDPFTGIEEDHPGLDISTRPGTEVRATGAGIIKKVNARVIMNKGYGKYIIIDHGYGYESLYAHLSKIFVREGQRVKRWDLIGLTGNTGKSTAPHLHYSVFQNTAAKDPANFFLE